MGKAHLFRGDVDTCEVLVAFRLELKQQSTVSAGDVENVDVPIAGNVRADQLFDVGVGLKGEILGGLRLAG